MNVVTAPDLNGNISKFPLMLSLWIPGPVCYLCHYWKDLPLCVANPSCTRPLWPRCTKLLRSRCTRPFRPGCACCLVRPWNAHCPQWPRCTWILGRGVHEHWAGYTHPSIPSWVYPLLSLSSFDNCTLTWTTSLPLCKCPDTSLPRFPTVLISGTYMDTLDINHASLIDFVSIIGFDDVFSN